MKIGASGDILIIEWIAAFGAEFGRILRIIRCPAAFVAAIERRACGLLCTTFCAKLALVHRSAGASPAFIRWFRRTALRAELASNRRSTGAFPGIAYRLWLLGTALGAELAGDRRSTGTLPTLCGFLWCGGALRLRVHLK